jgi:hypothetical protein
VKLENVVAGVVNSALELLEQEGHSLEGEMRERVHQLVEDQVNVTAMALAGLDPSAAQAALNARAKGLEAAGLIMAQAKMQQAIAVAIRKALQITLLAAVHL